MRLAAWLWVCLLLGACRTFPQKGTGPLAVAPPLLEKTFGGIQVRGASEALLTFKSITVGINCVPSESVDYLFLTAAIPANMASLRKDQKILAPSSTLSSLKRNGFSLVKEATAGKMIQLTKDGGFVLVRAADSRAADGQTKSYWMEFDNGRNVLILDPGAQPDDLRPFLYALRDEGKEVHLALASGASSHAAELIGLFQPQEAVIVNAGDAARQAQLQTELKDQFFQGALIFIKPGETVPF